MRIVLVYDQLTDASPAADLPEDHGAEYEDEPTVRALLDAIRACDHDAFGLRFGEDFPSEIRRLGPDLVLNIAEGLRGPTRESVVPAWLDHLGIPYTGSDGLTLAISLDKALTKTLVAGRGMRTPRFRRVRGASDLSDLDLRFPLFVKPNGEGSSMGIRQSSRVETPEELTRQVEWVLRGYRQDCLVEEFAPGREFCVGILGNEDLQFLPIVEVRKPADRPYDDIGKPRKEVLEATDVPEDAAAEMLRMGLEAFRALGCRDLARVDFKLDGTGRSAFLEINPLPGLSPFYSVFPYQAKAGGLSYEDLIGRIIQLAAERAQRRGGRG